MKEFDKPIRRERRAPIPSRNRLPQHVSPDRQRARRATLAMEREQYTFQNDAGPGHPFQPTRRLDDRDFALPANAAMLPKGEGFGVEKTARLAVHKGALKIRSPFTTWGMIGRRLETEQDYVRALGGLRRPPAVNNWRSDEEWGRQRLFGTDPMAIRRVGTVDGPPDDLAEAADGVLRRLYATNFADADKEGRLFETDFMNVLDPLVQSQVTHGATLPGTRSLFYAMKHGSLMPIAIRLETASTASCVVTPLDASARWLMARAHSNAAETHYHEGTYHLLETHMVMEVFKVATARHLHPDHPLFQLLDPHYEHNLAIDHLARNNLLSPGGPIDQSMAAGVGGTLDLARRFWQTWDFGERRFPNELAARGFGEKDSPIEVFPYRDDGGKLHKAINDYAKGVLRIWYDEEKDIGEDFELTAWAEECARYIPGFPAKIQSVDQLCALAADLIFRASVQHSAVNNGQFDTYGFIPNSPGTIYADIPREELSAGLDEESVFRAMPRIKRSQQQLGMCWVLSQATHRSLYAAGECPAFSAELCLGAYEEVQAFREQLRLITASIDERNESLTIPYVYLNPHNVGRSIAI